MTQPKNPKWITIGGKFDASDEKDPNAPTPTIYATVEPDPTPVKWDSVRRALENSG